MTPTFVTAHNRVTRGWLEASTLGLLLLGLSAGAGPAMADPAPFTALPFPARISMLMEDGEMAGRPVTIAAFETELGPTEMRARLRAQWSGDLRRPWMQTRTDAWEIASRQTPGGMVTLQYRMRESGGTSGLVSFWPRRAPAASAHSVAGRVAELAAVLPEDSRIAETASRDGARRTLTVLARSGADPEAAWARLVAGLRAQGYSQRRGPGGLSTLAHTRSAVFVRSDRELVVTLDGRGSVLGIVMQLTEATP